MRFSIVLAILAGGCARSMPANNSDATSRADLGSIGSGNYGVDGGDGNGSGGTGGGGSSGGTGGGSTGGTGGGSGGMSGTGAIPCGSSFCRVDETCTAGECVFPCSGAKVPGDYATVQAALSALENAGGTQTICLAAKHYAESINIEGKANITLLGISPTETAIDSVTLSISPASGPTTLRGFTSGQLAVNTFGNASASSPATVSATRLVITGPASVSTAFSNVDVQFDGVELSGGLTASATAYAMALFVMNSYIHGVAGGDCVNFTYDNEIVGTSVALLNDTIIDCAIGIDLVCSVSSCNGGSTTSVYQNNIIANQSKLGVFIDSRFSNSGFTNSNNALYGNAANFGTNAVEGSQDVLASCNLDGRDPPAPMQVSPCRGAGTASPAPTHDFWGAPRGSSVDIGAVQTQ